jgi:hypothetical protein
MVVALDCTCKLETIEFTVAYARRSNHVNTAAQLIERRSYLSSASELKAAVTIGSHR